MEFLATDLDGRGDVCSWEVRARGGEDGEKCDGQDWEDNGEEDE